MTKHDLATDAMCTVRFHQYGESGDVLQFLAGNGVTQLSRGQASLNRRN